jgi:hypothetical protein
MWVPYAVDVTIPSSDPLHDSIGYVFVGERFAAFCEFVFHENKKTRIFITLLFFVGAIAMILGLTSIYPVTGWGTLFLIPYNFCWGSLFSYPLLKRISLEIDFIGMIVLNTIALVSFIVMAPDSSPHICASVLYFFNALPNLASDARPHEKPSEDNGGILNLYGFLFQVTWAAQATVCQILLVMFYLGMWVVENPLVYNIGIFQVSNIAIGIAAFQAYTALKWRYLLMMFLQWKKSGNMYPVLLLRQPIAFHYIDDKSDKILSSISSASPKIGGSVISENELKTVLKLKNSNNKNANYVVSPGGDEEDKVNGEMA